MIKTCFESSNHQIPFYQMEDGLVLTSKPKDNSFLHIKQVRRVNNRTFKFISKNPEVVIDRRKEEEAYERYQKKLNDAVYGAT